MKLILKNKIILITGVGKGIGKSILEKLVKEKNIIYAVTRSVKDLKKIKKRKNLFLLHGDITKKEVINEIFKLAKKNKHVINCLINIITLIIQVDVYSMPGTLNSLKMPGIIFG